jgi:hypothetical protein
VRVALEPLLVALLFAAREINLLVAETPALELAVVAVTMAEDLLIASDDLDRVLVDPAEDQAALVLREREANSEVRLPAAGLPAVECLVSLAEERLGLRTRIWNPTIAAVAESAMSSASLRSSSPMPQRRAIRSSRDTFASLCEQERHAAGHARCRSVGSGRLRASTPVCS